MKVWIVRFASLWSFNVVVLLLIGLLPGVRVGWSALWAAVLLTAGTIWLKPLVTRWFRSMTAKSASQRSKTGEKLVQGGLVFVVELVIWLLVVGLSGISVQGWFLWWLLPPIALLVAWAIYDAVDDRIEARAGGLYDRAEAGIRKKDAPAASDAPPVPRAPSNPAASSKKEAHDGLTDEQRRMFDELN